MTKVKRTVEKTVDELRPFDDTFMQVLTEDKGFCEEMLRVVMDNPNLKVVRNLPQKHLHNIDTRSVTVDVLCEDEQGVQFSVEIQKEDNDDHQRRVRYNGACIQVRTSVKGSTFGELPDVYMIYITEKDFLKKNKTIYHVDRVLSETGEIVDNGYYEIYVNGEIDDGTTLAEYLKLLKSGSVEYNAKFPHTSNIIRYYKLGEGRKQMCKVVDEYAKDYAKEYAKDCVYSNLIQLVCKKLEKGKSISVIADELEETEENISRIVSVAKKYEPEYDVKAICEELLYSE